MAVQTVLLAVADERRLDALRLLLDQAGLDFEVAEASSWDEAQEALRSVDYDFYLLDQALVPDPSVPWAQLADGWHDRRWLLMLDEEDPDRIEAALRAGAADFLVWDTLEQERFLRTLRYARARSPRRYQHERTALLQIRDALKRARERLNRKDALILLHEEIAHVASIERTTSDTMLQIALSAVCTCMDWPLGHAWIVQEGDRLSSAFRFTEDPKAFAPFYALTRAMTVQRGDKSLPAQVIKSGHAIWIHDVTSDPTYPRPLADATLGIKAAFGIPVLMNGTVVAVLEYFATTDQSVTASVLESLEAMGIQIGRVFERERVTEALRLSEERFMLAVRGSHSGIWDWPDVNEDEQWWSPRFYELLGHEEGEIEARLSQFTTLLHPDDRRHTFTLLKAHFRDEAPFDVEYRLRAKTGVYRWFHARGEALRDARGRPTRMAGSLTNVDERKQAEASVRESRHQLRQLAARLQDVREAERTRLSREVHDVLGQALTGLRMDVAMIEKGLTEDQEALQARVDAMKQALTDTVQVVRRIAHELRPGILDDLGVLAAIEWETQRFASRTDIACTFGATMEELTLDDKCATAVFRVFQEIMTNVARHAGATEVTVTVQQQNGALVLAVHDDGCGLRDEHLQHTTSLGLLGMRERLAPWGGRIAFDGIPGEGTTVTVTLPLSHAQPAAQS